MVAKYLLFIVMLGMGLMRGYSQSLIQTYTDRCTGATQVFSVPMNGSTVVTFYNRSRSFTSQDFQNGTLQSWLEETYLWWTSLNPCSTTQTGATATQQTTQQTTQQATQAATNAAASVSSNPTTNAPPTTNNPPSTSQTSTPPPTDNTTANNTTGTEGTSTGGTSDGSTGTNDTGSGTAETGSSETQSGSTEDNSSSSETSESSSSSEGSSDDKSESSTEEKTEEVKEESSEEKTEEKKEESKEEEKKDEDKEESDESSEEDSEEESDEEKSEDEESEDDEEEDSEEESDNEDEEEEGEDKKKKRALAPPVVMANMLSQQGPDGRYTQAAMFGISQSSLLGTETYGLNAMVYSNLQQFMLTANYSKVHINKKGRVSRVYSGSIGGMKVYTTVMGMMNHSMVWMGEKGSVKGLAFGTTLTSVELDVRKGLIYYDNILLGASLTGFYTKPFNYNRWNIAPMVAVSNPFWAFDLFKHTHIWNPDVMIIGGSNFTFSLTQRFGINFGINIIESTIKDFPTLKTFTIGGRLSF